MDKACVSIVGILAVMVLGLVAMFRNYKVKADKKSITLEKNDKEQKERIVELEKKNGKEQKQLDAQGKEINKLKKEVEELKRRS